jgi:hypothetical protein
VTRSLGPALPQALLHALSQADLRAHLGRVLPLVTVDPAGRPHPMLLSYVEVLAVSPELMRVAMGESSGSAANMVERRVATLLIIEPDRTMYVKCRAPGTPLVAAPLARFDLTVEDVLEDRAAEWEGRVRITSGIGYAPLPSLDAPEARATLALLRADAARHG